MRANCGRTYQKVATQMANASAEPIPPIEAYEAFSASYLAQNPRTPKDSIMRDPAKLRRLAHGYRGRGPGHLAEAYGRSRSWVTKIINTLPAELR